MENIDISNRDLVLFALYEAGGVNKPINTEHVAHKVFSYPIGKKRFRWEHYGIYPDKERVARELRRLKNFKGNSFVKGHVNIGARKGVIDGWLLTSEGVLRVKKINDLLITVLGSSTNKKHIYEEKEFVKRINSSKLYKLFSREKNLNSAKVHMLTDLLYLLPDSSNEKINNSLDKLLANAEALEKKDILNFLHKVKSKFQLELKNAKTK